MKKIFNLVILIAFFAVFNGCTEDGTEAPGTNYITFSKKSFSAGVDVGGSTTVEIPVYTANLSGSERSFEITIAPSSTAAAGSYTVPNSVIIPANENMGTISIALTDTNLGIGVNTLVLNFAIAEGLSNGGSTTLSYIQNCTEITATLDITFDGYGSETSWKVLDALGGVVASKPAGTYADGQATASESITLCSGRDYTFVIEDSFGDGLSFPANGSYTLTIGSTVKVSGGGDFGSSESTAFDTK